MVLQLSTDYLVIGAGATGMAFVDELIHSSRDVNVIVVDKRSKPGGHWHNAYDFVKLHQPSAWYGVNSLRLGSSGDDLASKAQILAYYEQVLHVLESTGRVSFYPQCNYLGDGEFVSLMDEDVKYKVKVSNKTVDATYLETHVPSTTPPKYKVHEGVNIIPINGLVDIRSPWRRYVVIGAGKTGLDALSFLLDQKVDPDRIVWIISNDCWYQNRDKFNPDHMDELYKSLFNPILEAEDINEVFQKYEDSGLMMRMDKNICPTRFKSATVSSREMQKYHDIKNVIRQGRIDTIEKDAIIFGNGVKIPTDSKTLHIDCSTASSNWPPPKKIWAGDTICLQLVASPQSASGAMIASLEFSYPYDEEKKNQLVCSIDTPNQCPHKPWQFFKLLRHSNRNWDKMGLGWSRRSRLSFEHHMSMYQFLKTKAYMMFYGTTINEKLELFGQQEHVYGYGLIQRNLEAAKNGQMEQGNDVFATKLEAANTGQMKQGNDVCATKLDTLPTHAQISREA